MMNIPDFENQTLLQQALTHRSYARENGTDDNERLEFLGDSIIEFVVRDLLFENYPTMDEGEMSKRCDQLVDEGQLAAIAVAVGLPERLRLGHGAQHERSNASVQSDAFEALIGAYRLDAGIQATYAYVQAIFGPLVNQVMALPPTDPVSTLQEFVQAHFGGLPEYRELSATGPDNAKIFEIGVYINGQGYGVGQGRRKKDARKQAALEALRHFNVLP
jgi:ribonuclease-3